MTYEYRAFFPQDSGDSWSQDVFSPWEAERQLLERLVTQSKLPGGLNGVRVYKRQVSPSADVTSEFIKLSVLR